MIRSARLRPPQLLRRRLAWFTGAASLLVALHGSSAVSAGPSAQESEVDFEVVEVERLEHSTQLVVELHNPSDGASPPPRLSDPAFGPIEAIEFNDLSGVRLLDEAEDVEYLPFRDVEDKWCICSRLPEDRLVEADETWTVWWRSALLPDDVETVTVLGPEGESLATDVEVAG